MDLFADSPPSYSKGKITSGAHAHRHLFARFEIHVHDFSKVVVCHCDINPQAFDNKYM